MRKREEPDLPGPLYSRNGNVVPPEMRFRKFQFCNRFDSDGRKTDDLETTLFFIISNGRKTDHLEITYLPKAIDTFLAYLLGGNAFFIPVFRMLGESLARYCWHGLGEPMRSSVGAES